MPDLANTLPQYAVVRDATQRELPGIIAQLEDARAKGDASLCLPFFWGRSDSDQPVPGAWVYALPDPLRGVKGGHMAELLLGFWSSRFPSWKNTVYWAILIDRSHRLATRDECLAFFKQQEERKAQMAEANLRLKQVRAISVRPADKQDFSSDSNLDALREKVKLLKELRKLEGSENA